MPNASVFAAAGHYRPAESLVISDTVVPATFGDVAQEYRAAREAVALFDRSARGLVVVTGKDRKAWLQNLVTNDVVALKEGQGCYAFAADFKARVLFDLNVHCARDALWLDVERTLIARALAQFDRFLITEDVQMHDAAAEFARLGWAGPEATRLAAALGFGGAAGMAPLSSAASERDGVRLMRHDFTGGVGFELMVPRSSAAAWWDRLVTAGASPAGFRALDVLRIEAGIPWFGRDIDEKVIAPEADPGGRAISFEKGCYPGQEVIERMRSRGAQARRLVRLRGSIGAALDLPAELRKEGRNVGRITSLAPHPCEPIEVGLGYVTASLRDFSGIVSAGRAGQFAFELDALAVGCH